MPRGQAVAPGTVGVPEHAHVLAVTGPVFEKSVRVRRTSPGRGGRRAVRTSVHDFGGSLADAGPQWRRARRRGVVVGRPLDPEAASEQRPVRVVGVVPLAVSIQQRVVGRVLQPNADRRPGVVSGTLEQRFPVDHPPAFAVAPSAPDVFVRVPLAGRLHGVSGHEIVGLSFALVANLAIHHRVPRTPADHQRSTSVCAVQVVTSVPGVVVRGSGDGHGLLRLRVELTVPTTVAIQLAVRVVVTVRQRLAVVFERFSTYQFRVGPIRIEKS